MAEMVIKYIYKSANPKGSVRGKQKNKQINKTHSGTL